MTSFTWLIAIGSVVAISSLSILMACAALALKKETLGKIQFVLVSFAVGALLGDVFIHILPESFRTFDPGVKHIEGDFNPAGDEEQALKDSTAAHADHRHNGTLLISLLVIAGFLLFFIVEKIILWRHYNLHHSAEHLHPVVTMNLIGDGVHNLIDGLLIGASFIVSVPLGVATTLAATFHEIPQEIGDFGILIHGGLSVKKAIFFNFLSALMAVAGVIIALSIGSVAQQGVLYLLPITAGGFIYIAGPDLIPELQHESRIPLSLLQFFAIVLGVGLMAALTFFE